jgi:hypothetical protein
MEPQILLCILRSVGDVKLTRNELSVRLQIPGDMQDLHNTQYIVPDITYSGGPGCHASNIRGCEWRHKIPFGMPRRFGEKNIWSAE